MDVFFVHAAAGVVFVHMTSYDIGRQWKVLFEALGILLEGTVLGGKWRFSQKMAQIFQVHHGILQEAPITCQVLGFQAIPYHTIPYHTIPYHTRQSRFRGVPH